MALLGLFDLPAFQHLIFTKQIRSEIPFRYTKYLVEELMKGTKIVILEESVFDIQKIPCNMCITHLALWDNQKP